VLCALDFYLGRPKEIAIVGDSGSSDTQLLLREVWSPYLPNKVVAMAEPNSPAQTTIALLRDRPLVDGKPTAYVCENYTCQQPITRPKDLETQLR
jgi:uncharacterized protein YyaL (SSP411 family)